MQVLSYKTLILIALTGLLAACGAEETPLATKKLDLDTKKQALAQLKAEIDQLEKEIAALDTSDPRLKLRRVGAMQLVAQDFAHFIEVQGEVHSDKNVEVRPDINGTVIRRLVEEGQWVTAGQTLIELDAELIKNNIDEVKTRLELATELFQRQENLWNQKIGSQVQYLQAKNNKESLERNLETLHTQLEKARVKAPISGTIDEFFINSGEMANPALPVARIINLNEIEIQAEVSEAYTQDVKRSDNVVVTFPAIGIEVPAKISVVGQFINPKNRSFRIEIKLDNRELQVKPNTMTLVKIKDFEQKGAVVIPSHLIQKSTNGEKFLFIAQKSGEQTLAKKMLIEIGKSYQGFTLVKSGLSATDKVISEGYNEVVDGEEINITQESSLVAGK